LGYAHCLTEPSEEWEARDRSSWEKLTFHKIFRFDRVAVCHIGRNFYHAARLLNLRSTYISSKFTWYSSNKEICSFSFPEIDIVWGSPIQKFRFPFAEGSTFDCFSPSQSESWSPLPAPPGIVKNY
jgi:hypothetical protein